MITAAVGGVMGGLLGYMFGRRLHCARLGTATGRRSEALSNEDHEQIAAVFSEHTIAVQRQVSQYADALAEGDPRLRERLRLFEAGEVS